MTRIMEDLLRGDSFCEAVISTSPGLPDRISNRRSAENQLWDIHSVEDDEKVSKPLVSAFIRRRYYRDDMLSPWTKTGLSRTGSQLRSRYHTMMKLWRFGPPVAGHRGVKGVINTPGHDAICQQITTHSKKKRVSHRRRQSPPFCPLIPYCPNIFQSRYHASPIRRSRSPAFRRR